MTIYKDMTIYIGIKDDTSGIHTSSISINPSTPPENVSFQNKDIDKVLNIFLHTKKDITGLEKQTALIMLNSLKDIFYSVLEIVRQNDPNNSDYPSMVFVEEKLETTGEIVYINRLKKIQLDISTLDFLISIFEKVYENPSSFVVYYYPDGTYQRFLSEAKKFVETKCIDKYLISDEMINALLNLSLVTIEEDKVCMTHKLKCFYSILFE